MDHENNLINYFNFQLINSSMAIDKKKIESISNPSKSSYEYTGNYTLFSKIVFFQCKHTYNLHKYYNKSKNIKQTSVPILKRKDGSANIRFRSIPQDLIANPRGQLDPYNNNSVKYAPITKDSNFNAKKEEVSFPYQSSD